MINMYLLDKLYALDFDIQKVFRLMLQILSLEVLDI